MSLDGFWQANDALLGYVRTERPDTLAGLTAILGQPFSLDGGALMSALTDAGWEVHGIEGDYLFDARSPAGEWLHYCEGDILPGRWASQR